MKQEILHEAIAINNTIESLRDEKHAWTVFYGTDLTLGVVSTRKQYPISEEVFGVISQAAMLYLEKKIEELNKQLEEL